MTATVLLDELRSKGIRLSVEEDRLAVDAPKGMLTDALRQTIRQHKAEILSLLAQATPANDALSKVSSGETIEPVIAAAVPHTVAPCPHERTGRRADGTRVCLACVAVYADGVWTPQTIMYCTTTHMPYDLTPPEDPTRQCQACPACWYVACACGVASWKPNAHWGPDGIGVVQWTCRGCGTSYAPGQTHEAGQAHNKAQSPHEAAVQAS